MATKKKRRRKKRVRNIGKYESLKAGACTFRSSWEKAYFEYLDATSDVVSYMSESLKIPYISNKKTGKIRNYIPDLLVTYLDGHRALIEIKPKKRVDNVKNVRKFLAARLWCLAHGCDFVIITEVELKALGLL